MLKAQVVPLAGEAIIMATVKTPEAPSKAPQAFAAAPKPSAPPVETPKAPVPVAVPETPKAETPKAETPKLEVAFLAEPAELIPDAEMIKATAPRNARSDEQVTMDLVVSDYHKRWIASGRKSKWADLAAAVVTSANGTRKRVVATYFVSPEAAPKLKTLANKAGQLLDVRIRYGTSILVTEDLAKRHGLPGTHVGREAVSFAVMDKSTRGQKSETAQAAIGQARPESKPSE